MAVYEKYLVTTTKITKGESEQFEGKNKAKYVTFYSCVFDFFFFFFVDNCMFEKVQKQNKWIFNTEENEESSHLQKGRINTIM